MRWIFLIVLGASSLAQGQAAPFVSDYGLTIKVEDKKPPTHTPAPSQEESNDTALAVYSDRAFEGLSADFSGIRDDPPDMPENTRFGNWRFWDLGTVEMGYIRASLPTSVLQYGRGLAELTVEWPIDQCESPRISIIRPKKEGWFDRSMKIERNATFIVNRKHEISELVSIQAEEGDNEARVVFPEKIVNEVLSSWYLQVSLGLTNRIRSEGYSTQGLAAVKVRGKEVCEQIQSDLDLIFQIRPNAQPTDTPQESIDHEHDEPTGRDPQAGLGPISTEP